MSNAQIFRSWLSIRPRWSRLYQIILFLGCAAMLAYNFVTSEVYLNQLEEKVYKTQPEKARCCLNSDIKEDLCGNTGCQWPCHRRSPQRYDIKQEGEKAFFHETSGRSSLDFRQACSVESFAHLNPNVTVYVLMTGQIDKQAITFKTLTDHYSNVKMISIELGDYVAGTPLEKWYHCEKWNRGWFAIAHLSDALRLLSLFKYGGYYSDLDMIQLQPITSLRNFVVEEGTGKLGSSIIHVDKGHPFIEKALEAFPQDYKWYVWAHNGPDLITRVLQDLCNDYDVTWMKPERCEGFSVLPTKTFYPIHWFSWKKYFMQRDNDQTIEWGEDVVGAHVWNSKSSEFKVNKTSNQYYAQMARKSCPRTLHAAPDEF